jgi:hypothetical protein
MIAGGPCARRRQSEVLLNAVSVPSASAHSVNAAQQQLQQRELAPQQHLHNVSGGNATEPFLFIGVLSVPKSWERRNAVRQTWMQDAGPDVAVRFVLYEVRPLYHTAIKPPCRNIRSMTRSCCICCAMLI